MNVPIVWTPEDIEALKAALSSGVKRVRFRGPPEREVEYQSLGEMQQLLASMDASVNGATSYRRVEFSNGFRDG